MHLSKFRSIAAALALFATSAAVEAQQDSTATKKLDEVIVTGDRLTTGVSKIPLSISVNKVDPYHPTTQQLSINELLNNVPGLFVQNSNNFAQDTRISIRGFGARSAFGIRGIKLIVDGIPETTPDGQGQVDNVNIGLIEQIEVFKGPSSALYGNASGGVINITTLNSFEKDFLQYHTGLGSFNYLNQTVIAGLKKEKNVTSLFLNRTASDGYRNNSAFETYQMNLKSKWFITDNSSLLAQVNYTDSPTAQDAGGINAAAVIENRRQARDRNVLFQTGESVKQFKTGLSYNLNLGTNQLSSYAYYAYRDFEALLPFGFGGAIDINRNYWGQGSSYQIAAKDLKVKLGYDLGFQNDLRTRYRNEEGLRGATTLRQNEIFNNYAAYAIADYTFKNWILRGGARFDINQLKVEDGFLDNGDASDVIDLQSFNPSIGIQRNLGDHRVFANFSTAFETPVLSELSANPTNEGGFNQDLESQTATNYELGYGWKKKR